MLFVNILTLFSSKAKSSMTGTGYISCQNLLFRSRVKCHLTKHCVTKSPQIVWSDQALAYISWIGMRLLLISELSEPEYAIYTNACETAYDEIKYEKQRIWQNNILYLSLQISDNTFPLQLLSSRIFNRISNSNYEPSFPDYFISQMLQYP